MRPNCYECEYRRGLPGDAHSQCAHPSYEGALSDPLAQVLGIFASVGRIPPIQAESNQIVVRGSPHGIRNGWFNHPFNFDPVWLEECTGFTPKEKQ